mmetsp:Transcript_83136/g.146868  ORF Transcript_83136/g.146868 Transcript_83136/m.146868 type:complete len:416 (-) Transcript_83136:249-1496(-)
MASMLSNMVLVALILGLHMATATKTSVSVALHKRFSKVASTKLASKMKSVEQTEAMEEKAKSQHKMAYFGMVKVGDGQEFSVVFDTGSGNLIVPGTDCTSDACENHRRFDHTKSNSKAINCDGSEVQEGLEQDLITITFGTGHITGACFSDQVCVGNACSKTEFIVAEEESSQPFASFSFDGVLGLALDNMAQSNEFSVMNRLHNSGVLKQPCFSVFLSDSDQESSEITFGDIKKEHMASDLYWVPVNGDAGYWEVEITDIYFDQTAQNICKGCRVAVDTGTSELAGPSDVIAQLSERLGVNRDCSNFDKLPKLGFGVSGPDGKSKILSLSPSDYTSKGVVSCSVSLMDLDVPPPKGPLFVFGIPFLQKYFTVYDHEKLRVGFAVAKHEGQQPEILLEADEPAPSSKSSSFLSRH